MLSRRTVPSSFNAVTVTIYCSSLCMHKRAGARTVGILILTTYKGQLGDVSEEGGGGWVTISKLNGDMKQQRSLVITEDNSPARNAVRIK